MAASPDDDELERKRLDRIKAFQNAIDAITDDYRSKGIAVRLIEHGATDLGNTYWTLHEHHIRPHVSGNSNQFKIAALTEKVITRVQPFITPEGEPDREKNAKLAFCCAYAIMDQFDQCLDGSDIDWRGFRMQHTEPEDAVSDGLRQREPHAVFYEALQRILSEHIQWLETFDSERDIYPVFHCATFLDLLWHHLKIRLAAMANN